jgi:hypothetical protein
MYWNRRIANNQSVCSKNDTSFIIDLISGISSTSTIRLSHSIRITDIMSITPRLFSRATFASSSRHLIRSSSATIQCIAGPSRIRTKIPQPRSYRYATTLSPSSSASSPGIPPISPEPSIQVTPPSLEAIKEEGFFEDDVALIPQEEARLVITPQAVQVSCTCP